MWQKILSVSIFGGLISSGALSAIGGALSAIGDSEPPKDKFTLAKEEIERRQKEPLDKEAFQKSLEAKKRK